MKQNDLHRFTHDQRAFAPVARCARTPFDHPRYGRGLERQEEEGDCNLIRASPWRSIGSWSPSTDDTVPPPPAGSDDDSLNCQSYGLFVLQSAECQWLSRAASSYGVM